MEVDGRTILYVFGIVFAAGLGLVGVIWAMLQRRITSIEEEAREDRQIARNRTQEIFKKLDKVGDSMTTLATGIQELNANVAKGYVAKDDCRSGRGCA